MLEIPARVRVIGMVLLTCATAHADTAYVEAGPVTGIDFGAAPSRPIELGVRADIGVHVAERLAVFGAFRDMGTLEVIQHDSVNPVFGGPEPILFKVFSAGLRVMRPLGGAQGFGELYLSYAHLSDIFAIDDYSQDQFGAGVRGGAVKHFHIGEVLDLGVGAALSFDGFIPGKYSGDRSVSVSLTADAFVTVGF